MRETWVHVARLGPGAFDTISGEVVNVALMVHTRNAPHPKHTVTSVDASTPRSARNKASLLQTAAVDSALQAGHLWIVSESGVRIRPGTSPEEAP